MFSYNIHVVLHDKNSKLQSSINVILEEKYEVVINEVQMLNNAIKSTIKMHLTLNNSGDKVDMEAEYKRNVQVCI